MGNASLLDEEQWLAQLRHKDADDYCHMGERMSANARTRASNTVASATTGK